MHCAIAMQSLNQAVRFEIRRAGEVCRCESGVHPFMLREEWRANGELSAPVGPHGSRNTVTCAARGVRCPVPLTEIPVARAKGSSALI